MIPEMKALMWLYAGFICIAFFLIAMAGGAFS